VVTYYPLPPAETPPRLRPYPIGKPCPYADCRILLDTGEAVEADSGVQGELIVAGDSVTPGYVGDEQRNRAAFIMDSAGSRFYRTGDYVLVNEAGELEFLMRRDRMVKRRGYRIELDEIECVLNACQGVSDIAVTALSEEDETLIVACFCPGSAPAGELRAELKRLCQERLPAYFLPDRFVDMAALPKTSSGKIDYRGLQGLVG